MIGPRRGRLWSVFRKKHKKMARVCRENRVRDVRSKKEPPALREFLDALRAFLEPLRELLIPLRALLNPLREARGPLREALLTLREVSGPLREKLPARRDVRQVPREGGTDPLMNGSMDE